MCGPRDVWTRRSMDSGTSGTRADDLEFGRCGLVKVWTLRRRLRDNVDFGTCGIGDEWKGSCDVWTRWCPERACQQYDSA